MSGGDLFDEFRGVGGYIGLCFLDILYEGVDFLEEGDIKPWINCLSVA